MLTMHSQDGHLFQALQLGRARRGGGLGPQPEEAGVAAGLTNAQIGQQMFLSGKTVANNVSNILAKLHLAERGQAIVAARDAGLGRRPHGEPQSS